MLFSHWPIRNKLQLGLGLLAVSVLTLFGSAYYGLYAYRGLVKSLSARSAELPLANKLRDHVAELHEILNQVQDRQQLDNKFVELNVPNGLEQPVWDAGLLRQKYSAQLDQFCQTLERYSTLLDSNRLRTESGIGDDTYEQETLEKINEVLVRIQQDHDENAAGWLFGNEDRVSQLREEVETLRALAAELPNHLHERFRDLSSSVRTQYRSAIFLHTPEQEQAVFRKSATTSTARSASARSKSFAASSSRASVF